MKQTKRRGTIGIDLLPTWGSWIPSEVKNGATLSIEKGEAIICVSVHAFTIRLLRLSGI